MINESFTCFDSETKEMATPSLFYVGNNAHTLPVLFINHLLSKRKSSGCLVSMTGMAVSAWKKSESDLSITFLNI